MVVISCRRCGDTAIAERDSVPSFECAGERVPLCARCYEELRKLTESVATREVQAYFNRLRKIWGDREELRASAPPSS